MTLTPDNYPVLAGFITLTNKISSQPAAYFLDYYLHIISKDEFEKVPQFIKNFEPYLVKTGDDQYAFWGRQEGKWELRKIETREIPTEWLTRKNVLISYDVAENIYKKYHSPYTDEIDTLINLAHSATLVIKESGNESNKREYERSAAKFSAMSQGKPKHYSPVIRDIVLTGIAIIGIVATVAAIAATVAAIVCASVATAPASPVASFFAVVGISLVGLALTTAVWNLSKNLYEKAGNYFKSQHAYKEFNERTSEFTKSEKFCLFSSAQKTAKSENNENKNDKSPNNISHPVKADQKIQRRHTR